MGERTFKPFDDATVSLDVIAASARVNFNSRHNGSTARLFNSGTDVIFVKFGGADVVADTNDIPMLGDTIEVFAVPDGAAYCAAITAASPSGNVLYLTPGDGD